MALVEGDENEFCISVWEPLLGWEVEPSCFPIVVAKWAMIIEPFWWIVIAPLAYWLRKRYYTRKKERIIRAKERANRKWIEGVERRGKEGR